MKNFKYIFSFMVLIFFASCEEDNNEIGEIVAPTNVEVTYEIVGQDTNNPFGDGSGLVNFQATADNEITYQFDFGDDTSDVTNNGTISHQFTKAGVNSYQVVVNAIGAGGTATGTSFEIEVFSSFSDPQAESLLAGTTVGDSKTWYWAANIPTHVGLGPRTPEVSSDGYDYEAWWNAIQPFDSEKACMYADRFVFSRTAEGVNFQMTEGPAFVPGTYAGVIGVDADTCSEDAVIPVDMYGEKTVTMIPSTTAAATQGEYGGEPYRGTSFQISEGGFMGWYVGNSTYDIISISETEMHVRIEQPGSDFAWYARYQTTDPYSISDYDLVWEDNFDVDGAPNPANWAYDLGDGGWGNDEVQTYTDALENVVVEDGMLKITAKADGNGGYTSARIKTQDLYEFKYGKVEVRAKLPAAQGTWPAIWMLGANFNIVGWPNCGEIDIMEQSGQNKEEVFSTCHWFDTNAWQATMQGEEYELLTGTSEFHVYSTEWNAESIKFYVDNTLFYTLENNENLPFNNDFFLILNLAMGGNLGGDIDPNFTQDTMEIDYVKVYQ